MADLLDIAPSTACEVVKIDGKRIIVRGLNGPAIASIAARFPQVVGLLLGGVNISFNDSRLIAQFGDAIGPIIAAGCGHVGEEEHEKRAHALPLEPQIKLLAATWRLTFPNGLISFVEMVTALFPGADEGVKPVTVRLRKSPSPSQPLSDVASRPNMQ
jgi:hypothetical protein